MKNRKEHQKHDKSKQNKQTNTQQTNIQHKHYIAQQQHDYTHRCVKTDNKTTNHTTKQPRRHQNNTKHNGHPQYTKTCKPIEHIHKTKQHTQNGKIMHNNQT